MDKTCAGSGLCRNLECAPLEGEDTMTALFRKLSDSTVIAILLYALALPARAQNEWVQRYNGPGDGDDVATAMVVDSAGNAFVTGYSLGSGTGYDYATMKYSPTGARLWLKRYDGPVHSHDYA